MEKMLQTAGWVEDEIGLNAEFRMLPRHGSVHRSVAASQERSPLDRQIVTRQTDCHLLGHISQSQSFCSDPNRHHCGSDTTTALLGHTVCSWASLVTQMGRICLQRRRTGFDPWVGKSLWRKKWELIPVFLPGNFHGQRSLVGCSPWVRRVGHDWAINTLIHTYRQFLGIFLKQSFQTIALPPPAKKVKK